MTAAADDAKNPGEKSSSGGDFDLPGFKAGAQKPGGDAKGPKRAGKLPPGFKGAPERPARPEGRVTRKPPQPGDAPRRKFEGDFRPARGDREGGKPPFKKSYGDRPARPYGDKGARGGYGDRPPRPYGDRPARGGYGDKPAWKSDGPRKPYGDRDRGAPRRGFDGPKPAWKPAEEFKPAISPAVKKFLPLLTEKGRHKDSRFLIEGAKNVADVVTLSPGIIYAVLVAEDFSDIALREKVRALKLHTQVVPAQELNALCGTETPQGIVAVASFGALRPDWAKIQTVTLIDGVQDPGNLGAILRTSAALGMDAVVLGKGTCDAYNPKVVRASAASLLRLPLETGEDLASKIHFLRLKGFTVVATSPHAKITLEQAKLRKKVALLFGNEGGGVGENLIDQADAIVRIPMKGKVESLNVAVAHGLLTYDLMRLRQN